MMRVQESVCVLGAGAWGTAVALLLARNNYRVRLWCYESEVAAAIANTRYNERYLPGVPIDERIEVTTDLIYAIDKARWIFEAIPVQFMRATLEKCKGHPLEDKIWVVLSKGIENNTLLLPSEIIDSIVGTSQKAAFSGPSFARDLVNKQITAVTISASDYEIGCALQTMLANDYFRPYVSLDLIGAQVGGALKNIIATGVGLLDGAGYTDNAKAFLITRGLQEIVMLTHALGGQRQTVYGLSGVGDLILTAMGALSRNVNVGRRLARGENLATVLAHMTHVPEGINTIRSVQQLIEQKQLDLPICSGVYQVVFEGKAVDTFLHELMARPLERECEL